MSRSILEVTHLCKNFGSFTAVNDISFSVREGEILGLLGPNGAGKTTTITMLLGVITPTSGVIRFFGKEFPEHRQEVLPLINYSSAYTRPPWRLTVWEHLYVFANLYGVAGPERRILGLLEAFHLTDEKNTLCGDLSSGNIARVNLCKAFINFPKLVLLDEPTSSMDPEIARLVREYLLRAQERYNTSILITSHNMAEIEELADRVIFMNYGKIMAAGSPEELVKRTLPTSRVRLFMRDGQKRTVEYLKTRKVDVSTEDRYVEFDIKSEDVAKVLNDLAKKGVDYSEISIDKPTLEDYFVGEATHEQQ